MALAGKSSQCKATPTYPKQLGALEERRKNRNLPTTEHCPEQFNKKLVKRIAKTLTDEKTCWIEAENRLR